LPGGFNQSSRPHGEVATLRIETHLLLKTIKNLLDVRCTAVRIFLTSGGNVSGFSRRKFEIALRYHSLHVAETWYQRRSNVVAGAVDRYGRVADGPHALALAGQRALKAWYCRTNIVQPARTSVAILTSETRYVRSSGTARRAARRHLEMACLHANHAFDAGGLHRSIGSRHCLADDGTMALDDARGYRRIRIARAIGRRNFQ